MNDVTKGDRFKSFVTTLLKSMMKGGQKRPKILWLHLCTTLKCELLVRITNRQWQQQPFFYFWNNNSCSCSNNNNNWTFFRMISKIRSSVRFESHRFVGGGASISKNLTGNAHRLTGSQVLQPNFQVRTTKMYLRQNTIARPDSVIFQVSDFVFQKLILSQPFLILL